MPAVPSVWCWMSGGAAQRGIPVDLLRHNGRARVHRRSGQRRSNKSKYKEQPLSVCYENWAEKKTLLEQPRQARCQANSSGNSGWPATARRLQGQTFNYEWCCQIQANSWGDRDGAAGYRHELQWRLPQGGNRTALEGVTVIRLTHWDCRRRSRVESRLANLPICYLQDPLS